MEAGFDVLAQGMAQQAGINANAEIARARYRALNHVGTPIGLVSNRGKVIASGSDPKGIAGGWGFGGVGAMSAPFSRGGRDVIQLTGNPTLGSATSFKARRKIATTAFTKLGVWIETPNVTAGAYTINIYYTSDVPAADPPTSDWANGAYKMALLQGDIMFGSRQCIAVRQDGKLYSQAVPGGTSWASIGTPGTQGTISQLHIELVCDANVPVAQRWLNIDFVELDVVATPLVMLGFDGTSDPVVAQLFASRNIPWYNASDGDNLAANAAFINDFLSRGNELVCNGWDHQDYALNPAQLALDIDKCRAIYTANGWPMDNTFAYPLNSRNAGTDAVLIQKGFKAARSFRHPPISYSDRGVPMTVPNPTGINGQSQILNFGSYAADQQTAVVMETWVEDAIACGHNMNMYAHNLTTSTSPTPTQTNLTEYTTILDSMKNKHETGLIRLVLPKQFAALMGM